MTLTHRGLSFFALATIGATLLVAHEGHAPLPTRGVQADPEKGDLLLTADARASIDVGTAVVEMGSIEERVLAYASVVAPWQHHAFVTSKLSGRVVKVHAVAGQQVRAGDTLAEVESMDLSTLQQELLTAQSEVRLSEKLVAQLRQSADRGIVSGQAVLDAETKNAQNRNALDVARAKWAGLDLPPAQATALLLAGEPVGGLTLPVRAPVAGVVVHAEFTAGKVVDPAEHLAEIMDLSSVWVRIGVLEKDLRRVRVGQGVEVELVAYPGEAFRAAVRATSPSLDPVTNLYTVWAELANPSPSEPRFQPGMAGRAYLLGGSEKHRPTVPAAAIIREGAERFVLVEAANAHGASEYRRVWVTPGREGNGRVEILSGDVFPGDRVVTRGAALLGPFFAPTVLKLSQQAIRTMQLAVEPAAMIRVDDTTELEAVVEVPPAHRGSAASQFPGTVHSIEVDRGQKVKAGDVVARVFSPELLTLQQEFLRAHLEAALTGQTLTSLKSVPGTAARQLWELESQLATLTAQRDTLRRKLGAAGLTGEQIERVVAKRELVPAAPVRAPLSGVIVSFDKVLGQAVAAHEPLFEVHDLERPLVRGFVSERDVGRVRPGQSARVRLAADPGFVGTGRVVRSDRTVSTGGRTLSVWVELDEHPKEPLLHNQLAQLTVVGAPHPPVLAVPRGALVSDGSAAFVFVRAADGSFERRAVETGRADDRFVAVTRGLESGELVAASGAAELMTGHASLR